MTNPNKRILTLHLKRQYWEQIRDGVKWHEYRRISEYWKKRLEDREYDEIHLKLGYPPAGDIDRTLIIKWNGFHKTKILHDHFGKNWTRVYAIDVTQKIEQIQEAA